MCYFSIGSFIRMDKVHMGAHRRSWTSTVVESRHTWEQVFQVTPHVRTGVPSHATRENRCSKSHHTWEQVLFCYNTEHCINIMNLLHFNHLNNYVIKIIAFWLIIDTSSAQFSSKHNKQNAFFFGWACSVEVTKTLCANSSQCYTAPDRKDTMRKYQSVLHCTRS